MEKKENILKSICGAPDRPLRIGDLEIPCYVLENEKRVLVLRGMLKSLDMKHGTAGRGAGDRLVKFASTKSIKPSISNELMKLIKKPIKFKIPSGVAHGYEATILADICDAVLDARKKGTLHYQQEHIADRCEILIRGFARVGIIALVDEATGYQDIRVKNALEKILEKYLLEKQKPYIGTFPIEFYKQIFRLNNWPWDESSTKRPGVIGTWTNDIVYERLAPTILEELQKRNPSIKPGRRRYKHFQFLTDDVGEPKLRAHFDGVMALMRASANWRSFKGLLQRAFPKFGETYKLPFPEK